MSDNKRLRDEDQAFSFFRGLQPGSASVQLISKYLDDLSGKSFSPYQFHIIMYALAKYARGLRREDEIRAFAELKDIVSQHLPYLEEGARDTFSNPSLSSKFLVTPFWAIDQLYLVPSAQYQAAFWPALHTKLREEAILGPSFSHIILPMAQMGIDIPEKPDILDMLQNKSIKQMRQAAKSLKAGRSAQNFKPAALTDSLLGFSKLKPALRPKADYMIAWEELSILRMERGEFSYNDLIFSITAFANLRVRPSDQFMECFEKQAKLALLDARLSPKHLSRLVWGMASIGYRPSDQFLKAWDQSARKQMVYANEQDRANSIWAMGVFSALGSDINAPKDIIKRLLDGVDYDDGNYLLMHKKQIRDACLLVDLPTAFPETKDGQTKSKTEQRLRHLFAEAGPKMGYQLAHKASVIPRLNHEVDFTMCSKNRNIDIEFDGEEYHFISKLNPKTKKYEPVGFDGGTLMQTAIMKKIGSDIQSNSVTLRIPGCIFNALESMDVDNQDFWIYHILEKASNAQRNCALYVGFRAAAGEEMDLMVQTMPVHHLSRSLKHARFNRDPALTPGLPDPDLADVA